MTVDEALTRVVQIEAQIAKLQADQFRLFARIVEDPCEGAPAPALEKNYLHEEVRAALGEPATASENRIHLAQTVVHRLPLTLAAMDAGELTWRHANALVNAVDDLSDDDAARLEAKCVPFVAGHDYTAFSRKIRRELAALDTSTVEERLERAADRLTAWHRPDPDGLTATVGAVLPAIGACTVMVAIERAAALDPDEGKTRDQRRADGLVRIASDWLGSTLCTTAENPGPPMQVQVTVALSTLRGFDDQPGELDGHGALPAALVREAAAGPNAIWRRLVTDDCGRLLDYGRTRYRPPARLREFVIARDRECQFPGCHRRGRYCELDHLRAWADGGLTNERNLICLCARHHHLKHDTTWTVERLTDGTLRWTSPNGRVHLNEPASYPIDATRAAA